MQEFRVLSIDVYSVGMSFKYSKYDVFLDGTFDITWSGMILSPGSPCSFEFILSIFEKCESVRLWTRSFDCRYNLESSQTFTCETVCLGGFMMSCPINLFVMWSFSKINYHFIIHFVFGISHICNNSNSFD